jgi:protoporphyrinogen oxidase/SAM-dependent methyltransferase
MSPAAVCVIGGGIGGASAALHLARSGAQVTIVEATDQLGGLVASFEIGGTPLERYYHHVFPQETAIQELIEELGLAERLSFLPSSVGVLTGDQVWPFTTPRDVMTFKPLPVKDRLMLGAGGLRMARPQDWEKLDEVRAVDWLSRMTGNAATTGVWEPLLRSKFGTAWHDVPAAWMWGRFDQRRGARDRNGRERLGYLRGGFAQLFEALQRQLVLEGVDLQLRCRVLELSFDGRGVRGVKTDRGELRADAVLWTGGLPALSRIVPPEWADPRWTATGRLGVTSLILELARPLTNVYWTNVCDDSAPYGAIVEHTNLLPLADYGRHVVYVARYHTDGESITQQDPEAVADEWVADLLRRFPSVSSSDIIARHVFRAPYAAPLVQVGHSRRIPPLESHVQGLYVATTAQIYPHDRGMNDGIVLAREASDLMLEWLETSGAKVLTPPLGRCPVCGGTARKARFSNAARDGAGECGIRSESFRPATCDFGRSPGLVAACVRCDHASVVDAVDTREVSAAYAGAEDAVTLREREGRLITARRGLSLIERHAPAKDASRAERVLLDIGCWTGEFLVEAREHGWRVHGVEPSSWAAGIAREAGLDVAVGELGDLRLAESSVDVIVMTDVLEHLDDPAGSLREIRRLLVPGGLLYLTIPDAGSRLARLLGQRWWSVLPMHLQYFTRPSLTRLLRRSGFDVLDLRTHAKEFTVRYYSERVSGYSPAMSRVANRVLEVLGIADRLIAPDFGDRMEVVARLSTFVEPHSDVAACSSSDGEGRRSLESILA